VFSGAAGLGAPREIALWLGFAVCLLVRAVALWRGWSLPRYRPRPGRTYE
jgi:uncharacterized membrane protein YeiH